jgi:outer membrane protein assembly factor BamB
MIRALFIVVCACACHAADWPMFRGAAASGVADGMKLPESWDGQKRANIRWVIPVPGLAHSSPVIAGDRIFLTTAVSSRANATFKPGLYGEGTASDDMSVHRFQVLCVDRRSGKLLWTRTAYEGVPKEKRHIKSTYASSSPVTDGRVVVALFGSQGLYAFDIAGKQLWSADLGRIDAGAYDSPDYEWGTASSPIIWNGSVFVQVDQQKNSFLAAYDLRTGRQLWKTERQELPSWATPNVYAGGSRAEIVTNAPNRIRGYDPRTGRELWTLGGSSKITAPTPIFSKDLIFVASGRRPEAPIFAIRPGANGDITMSDSVAWRKLQRGSYMPTPILYGGLLYVLGNAGIFDCYDPATGAEIYRERLPHQGSGFSASPVASDGLIYLSSEDGEVFVVRAGKKFELLGRNPMGEPLMATPALAGGTMYIRGERHLFAVGR